MAERYPIEISPSWKRYLTDYNEGLGLVYERFVLNDFLLYIKGQYGFYSVLEAPLFGMAGVSGINSVALVRIKCPLTLVDDNSDRLAGVVRIWAELGLPAHFVLAHDWDRLPFPNNAFDFVWNWAALWRVSNPQGLLREMVRCSRKLVFVAVPNPVQIGYQFRKYVAEPEFVREVDEKWTDIGLIRRHLEGLGVKIIGQGVLDVPPWPDTVMPASELLRRLGIRSRRLMERFQGDEWHWSAMDYYLGRQPDLYDRIKRYMWLEKISLPWQIKQLWAHHRWVLAKKPAGHRLPVEEPGSAE